MSCPIRQDSTHRKAGGEVQPAWWQTEIIYQIYPLSFQDTNGDGKGDLRGILSRLDYLQSLNVGCLWLSPIFPSPMRDFGYDVADYCDIHPWFGTLADFDALLADVHARGMRLILDFVPNHTSSEHPWFVESRANRHNPKRSWYIWRDPAPGGGPPNNWLSFFGGPAWTLDETTGQYYLHQFDSTQPELNYRNPEVLNAMLTCMRFWLERGIDGFRVDVIWLLIKDELLRDEPLDPGWDGVNPHGRLRHVYTADQPEVHEVIRAMRSLLDRYGDRLLVGEVDLPPSRLMAYYGTHLDECHQPINFLLIHTPWRARAVRQAVNEYERVLPPGACPNWVLGNHDRPRLASRLGQAQARVATLLLLTLRGTPTWYYGDEIGLENGVIPMPLVRDPQALNQPAVAQVLGRDPQRTPMQWNSSPNAGFTPEGIKPWLPVSGDFAERNVERESRDPRSFLSFFRALTTVRQKAPALRLGDYAEVETEAEDVFAYRRFRGAESYLIVLNFAARTVCVNLGVLGEVADILLSTTMARTGRTALASLEVGPDEGLLLKAADAWSA